MFTLEKKSEWIASVSHIETALQLAREHGVGTEVRRTEDGVLCARVGSTKDLLKAMGERDERRV